MILLCRCAGAGVLDPSTRDQALRRLTESGSEAVVVDDLCGLAAARGPILQSLAKAGHVTVAACHERAVRGLLRFAGVEVPPENLMVLDLREGGEGIESELRVAMTKDAGEACAKTQACEGDSPTSRPALSPVSSDEPGGELPQATGVRWIPWYPVIDHDRCVNCGQCVSFCLFGVYAKDGEGQARVVNPTRCKTNCPACARMCPQVAIVFPKYPEGPISGQPVRADDLQRSDLRVKPSILRGNIHAALKARAGR